MDAQSDTALQTRRRRWFGGICLAGAIGMLVLGEVSLKGRLGPGAFLIYWFICFVLTILSIFIALADLRAVKTSTRKLQQDLMMETLREIEKQKQAHDHDDQRNGS